MPPVQKLDAHCWLLVHGTPFGNTCLHTPATQKAPSAQSPSTTQSDRQEVLLAQVNGAHETGPGAMQMPVPLQTLRGVKNEPTQVPGAHAVPGG
jgi:hypothetical protein